MAAKIAKYLGFTVFGLLIVAVGALFVINDKTIEAAGGPLAPPALSLKHGILNTFHSAAGSGENNRNDQTPRVVLDLPPAPVPQAIATPVETKSLAEIAAETQQEYTMRDSATAAAQDTNQTSPVPSDPMSPVNAPPLAEEQAAPLSAGAPPPPPAMAEMTSTDDTIGSGAPLEAAPAAPADPATASPSNTTDKPMDNEELALLESLGQSPSDDVAALPPETAEESENVESATEEDQDPTGEQAYAEGLQFYSGEGVERNFGMAAQFFMKAAERGHAEAQYSLGLMNYVGQTGGQDFSNAAKWFQMAAETGHIQAQYNLGFLYYEGKGVQQDLKTAYGWIDRAAQQGYAKAVKARDALKKAMPEMFGS